MITCQICGKEYKSNQPLSKHITSFHNISKQLYYDNYLKSSNEGFCKVCNKPTHFQDITKGYTSYCCKSCQVKAQGNGKKINHADMWNIRHQHIIDYEKANNCTHIKTLINKYNYNVHIVIKALKIPVIKESKMYQYIDNKYLSSIDNYITEIKEKEKDKDKNWNNSNKSKQTVSDKNIQFEKDNNCTQIKTLIQKYGQGWKALQLPTIARNHNAHFISNDYLPMIEQYTSEYHASNKEKYIYDEISKIYTGKILHNTKRVISPNELDIYIPDLKLAIEFNGLFWHSTKHNIDKDYHLNKSIACRNLNIRLIHVYEFENIEEQVNKIISLINGLDLFNKNDFNKNNLESNIPDSEIIYKDENYTIYGPGPLWTT